MSTTVQASVAIEERRRFVENALGSLRIEGLELDAEARAIVDRYIAGEIPREEMARVIRALP